MSAHSSIDDVYAEFVRTLPADLVDCASALPVVLQLAPSRDIPWSEVFSHEMTLGAPRLVAEGMPGVRDGVVRDASLAHLLAIVEAFGTDRLLDGQIEPNPALDRVLAQARSTRDEALARVLASVPDGPSDRDAGDPVPSYARADADTVAAIQTEHEVLRSGQPVSWSRYVAVSHGKQRLGLPASLALARAAGWDARRRRTLARLLDAVWVGLQLHDDVLDWEEDLSRGGAWAVSLAAPSVSERGEGRMAAGEVRQVVFASGALHRMLRHSAQCFRAARRRAEALHLGSLAAWARGRELHTADVARREAESPGQTNRAHALSNWAKSVLRG